MSQSIGIHVGERSFHLVALEGGLKRHKLVCAHSGEIEPGEEGAQAAVERLREIVKEEKLSGDSVYLVMDSGAAAFRTLTLPFDDREKIEEVIKFEIEGNLPQYDIDQVVVDFQVLSSKPGVESNLLVTAVPKERLRAALRLCEQAGLEALDAELEGTALFDAAFEKGILEEEVGTVLINVGDTSTTVVVADGRRLASLRAIRVGAHSPRAGETTTGGETAEGEAPLKAPGESEAARLLASAQRIRREMVRTLSGARTSAEIRSVYVCGHELPGLRGESLLDVPIEPLPFTLEDAEPAGEYVVAFGAALRGFEGGTLRPQLRREELRFSGRFERMELSFAVFLLLLFTLLFVQYIVLGQHLQWRDEGRLATNEPGDLQLWLEESNERVFPDPTNTRPVLLPDAPADMVAYANDAKAGKDLQRTKYEELQRIRYLLRAEIDRLAKDLGKISETKQPQSALAASTLVMDVITTMSESESVRVGIRRFEANFQYGSAGKEDYVIVTLDADFFGEDSLAATRSYEELEKQCESKPWCLQFEGKSSKSFEKGITVDGLSIHVDVSKAPQGGQS